MKKLLLLILSLVLLTSSACSSGDLFDVKEEIKEEIRKELILEMRSEEKREKDAIISEEMRLEKEKEEKMTEILQDTEDREGEVKNDTDEETFDNDSKEFTFTSELLDFTAIDTLEVNWHKEAKEIDKFTFISEERMLKILRDLVIYPETYYDTKTKSQQPFELTYEKMKNPLSNVLSYYETGEIQNGKIYTLVYSPCSLNVEPGMCMEKSGVFRFLFVNSNLYLLDNFNRLPTNDEGKYKYILNELFGDSVLKNINDIGLYADDKIIVNGTEIYIEDRFYNVAYKNFTLPHLNNGDKFIGEDSKGNKFYEVSNGCVLVKNADGSISSYYYDLDFIPKEENITTKSVEKVKITWNDGSQNEDYYIITPMGGCGGYSGCYSVRDDRDEKDLEGLEIVGKTSDDRNVLAFNCIDPESNENIKFQYNAFWAEEKPSIEEFCIQRPLLYIENDFGTLLKFIKEGFEVAAECGKPVIYLYPEETMDIEVKVAPNGGFTYTEPEYNDGWFVSSTPESEIYNYENKETYPYLFWEGIALQYEMPEEGFVFSAEELENGLREKLELLGLIEKEIDDFMEFWYPRILESDAPYYFVSFLEQKLFDELAPLEVTPSPDTIIRVFMDYKPLEEKVEVVEPVIITPKRNGFIVSEWGGELRP